MDKEIIDFTESYLKEIFTKVGIEKEFLDKAVKDYIRYRENELSSFNLLGSWALKDLDIKGYIKTLRSGAEIIEDIVKSYLYYLKEKKAIAEKYQETKDWNKVITTVVFSDSDSSQEAFIDYVEEIYQTKVKDAKHLKKLCNINTDKEGDGESLEGLEETIINSRKCKFNRAIETAIDNGAKYKDLLQIEPKDYGLTETYQEEAILRGIGWEFYLREPGGLMIYPALREIAKEMEAPYSVVMDAFNFFNLK